MNTEKVVTPVSDDAPCGPDLYADIDAAYEEYYFGALGRLPGFYMQPGVQRPDGTRSPDRLFDSKSVDHRAEAKEIDTLLARSRDLRLLVLQVQWDALAGRLAPVAASIDAIAALLERFPDDVHPTLADGPTDRRDALNDLNQQITVAQPLMFIGLSGTDEVTLRKLRVAGGHATPMLTEEDLETGPMISALKSPANRKAVEATHAEFLRISNALTRIQKSCSSHGNSAFSPTFDHLTSVVDEVVTVLQDARPDLRGSDVEAADVPAEPESVAPASGALQAPPSLTQATPAVAPSAVVSHVHARRMLEACELYYRASEPSSAALLLVTQARLLIGKPLIDAVRALLPGEADKAVVDFGAQSGFQLAADRLGELSEALPDSAGTRTELPQNPGPDPEVASAAQAAQTMRAVEDYFRRTERSSPVPLLLQRARSYLDRDFQSLIDELIPTQT